MKDNKMQTTATEKQPENKTIPDVNKKANESNANVKNDVKNTESKNANTEAVSDAKAENRQKNEKAAPVKEVSCEPVDELGIISAGTRVEGNIEAKGNLQIAGTVEGNVTATGNVTITGNVKGLIKCKDLVLENCNLTAEIQAAGDVFIKRGSVNGGILCKNINVAGTVNGNINAGGTIALLDGAVVRGDIKATRMGMEFGAFVDGKIMMAMPQK